MKDDIIRMALEAGLDVHPRKEQVRVGIDALIGIDSTEKVERFAELVRADERKAMAAEAAKHGWAMKNDDPFEDAVREIAAIRARGQA